MYRTETLNSSYNHPKVPWHVLCDISMATQWAPDPLCPKGKVRVPLLQEVLAALDVYSVGVSEYGHYTAQAQESLSDYGATKYKYLNNAFFILGRYRSGNKYVAMVTS